MRRALIPAYVLLCLVLGVAGATAGHRLSAGQPAPAPASGPRVVQSICQGGQLVQSIDDGGPGLLARSTGQDC